MKITPYLSAPIESQNTIYCSTFQLAWNELMEKFAKGPIELLASQSPAAKIVAHLNEMEFKKDQLSNDCYLAMGGVVKEGIIDAIKKALVDKFHEQTKVKFEATDPEGIITYAFLRKNVHFIEKFSDLPDSMYFEGTPVSGFGTLKSNPIGRNVVEILHYHDPENFAVRLRCKEENDDLIMAMIMPQETLWETIKKVEHRSSESVPTEMALSDTIAIPVIDFDIEHHFDELIGHQLSGKLSGMHIADALQCTKFNLNAEGAMLRSEAQLSTYRCVSPPNKKMLFQSPFLIYMKQKGQSRPYFAIWVQDTEFLQKKD